METVLAPVGTAVAGDHAEMALRQHGLLAQQQAAVAEVDRIGARGVARHPARYGLPRPVSAVDALADVGGPAVDRPVRHAGRRAMGDDLHRISPRGIPR